MTPKQALKELVSFACINCEHGSGKLCSTCIVTRCRDIILKALEGRLDKDEYDVEDEDSIND